MASSDGVIISYDGKGQNLDTAEDAEPIFHQMNGQKVDIVILRGKKIGIEAAEHIGQELAHHPELKAAHFNNIFVDQYYALFIQSDAQDRLESNHQKPYYENIDTGAMDHLLKGIIKSGAKLTTLDLSDNDFSPLVLRSVVDFLRSSSAETLEKLYLNNCGLVPESSTTIAACLPKLRRLREFVCGRNVLQNKGARRLSRSLSHLKTLERLILPKNEFRPTRNFCEALISNILTLTEIDLSGNDIGFRGALALEHLLPNVKNLKILRLNDTRLGPRESNIIICALSKSQALSKMEEVSLEKNPIHGEDAINCIVSTFARCHKHFSLHISNYFNEEELGQLLSLSGKINIKFQDSRFETDTDDEDEVNSSSENQSDINDAKNEKKSVTP